jgi:uncharacterized membrane protein
MENKDGIEFYEDEAYESRLERQDPLPEKGLEGWVYGKMPGKYSYKRLVLIVIILALFIISFIFIILGLKNVNDETKSDFDSRINNTRLK